MCTEVFMAYLNPLQLLILNTGKLNVPCSTMFINSFIYGLFDNAVSSTNYTALDDRKSNE
jgi:hypothetical protein